MIDYNLLNQQLSALIKGVGNNVSILANAAALLKEQTNWFWIGFYIVNDRQLELGPFQGPVACFTIPFGKGVCGTAWKLQQTLRVPDVHQFPGHIACSSLSNSEIVLPLFKNNSVFGVLDIDSTEFDDFSIDDQRGLEQFCQILAEALN